MIKRHSVRNEVESTLSKIQHAINQGHDWSMSLGDLKYYRNEAKGALTDGSPEVMQKFLWAWKEKKEMAEAIALGRAIRNGSQG